MTVGKVEVNDDNGSIEKSLIGLVTLAIGSSIESHDDVENGDSELCRLSKEKKKRNALKNQFIIIHN